MAARDPSANAPLERAKSRNVAALRPLLRYVAPHRWRIVGAAIALLIAASTVLALGAGLRFLIDRGFVGADAALLDRAVLILLGVVAVLALASYCRFYLVSWIGERAIADLRRDVYAHVIGLDAGFFDATRSSEIGARLTTDTSVIQTVVGSSVSVALRNALMLVGGTVMMFVTSVKLTLLVFLVVPLVLVPILTFGRRVRRLSRASQDRLADVATHVDESLAAFRTVQAFTHERHDVARFVLRVEASFDIAIERIRARAFMTACVMLLVFGAVSVILWIGGRDVLAGGLTPGELSAFVFYAVVVAGGAGALSEVVGELQRAAGAAERLFELLAIPPGITAPAWPETLPTPAEGRLLLHRVTFHYPTRPERAALEALSLEVAPGEKVALVGPSGAGKSTVFQLLLRFYDPDQGVIALDGVDLRAADPAALRGRIGLVPQDPVIFAASAADNIRYGRPDARDDEVRAAAEAAHALEFIERLPGGFDSDLGERGVRLSGGQRQRIAIARAILRDPVLLLLDEATSALDAESERAVQQALERLMEGRTTLVIAHRLATVQSTDRIVVLDRGRVVAQGRHAELVRQGGLYARLAALQFDLTADLAAAGQ